MVACARIAAGGWRPRRRWRLKGPGRTFSIVDPAGTWAWRSGPVDAAAVRQGAVLALLYAEAAVQLRAVAKLPRRAEAAYQRRRYPRCPATARQEACDRPEWSRHCLDRFSHLDLPARCRSLRHQRHRHDGLAARSRQAAYLDARRRRRRRLVGPRVW